MRSISSLSSAVKESRTVASSSSSCARAADVLSAEIATWHARKLRR